MKRIAILVSFACLLLNLTACGVSPSKASTYMKAREANAESVVTPPVNPTPLNPITPVDPDIVVKDPSPTGETGDADKGKILLTSCMTCHATGKTKLDASAVGKLDDAYTGPQATTHSLLKTSFENPGLLDLEAALKLLL